MTREEARAAIEAGIALVESERPRGLDLIGTGEMGIGNTTAASAMVAVLTGAPVGGRSPGRAPALDEARPAPEDRGHRARDPRQSARPRRRARRARQGRRLRDRRPRRRGAGGRRASHPRHRGRLHRERGRAGGRQDWRRPRATTCSRRTDRPSRGTGTRWTRSGSSPYLDLGMRLGEGTGAALCIDLARAAVKLLTEMATFKSAGVSTSRQEPRET